MSERQPFDARCLGCDSIHIIHVGADRSVGDSIHSYPHHKGTKACGECTKHVLVGRLTGIKDVDP